MVLILPRFLELDGVWLAFPITDGLTVVLTIILLIPQITEFQRDAPASAPGQGFPPGMPPGPPGRGFPVVPPPILPVIEKDK